MSNPSRDALAESYFVRGSRHAFVLGLFTFFAALSGFLTRMFLARVLTPDEYGLFFAVFTFFMMLVLFTDLGYGQTLVKFIPEFLVKKQEHLVHRSISLVALFTVFSSFIVIVALALLARFLAVHYFKDVAAIPLLYLFSAAVFLNSFIYLFQQVHQAFQDMFLYALLAFLSKFLILLFAMVLFFLGVEGVLLGGFAFLAALLTLFVLFFIPFARRCRPGVVTAFDSTLFRKLSLFALPLFLSVVGSMVIGYIDTLLLVFYVPLETVGVYNAVLPTVLALSFFGGVIGAIFFPMVSELWARGERERLRRGLSLIYRYSLAVVLPFSLAMLFYADTVLRVLFGESFVVGTTALRFVAVSVLFLTFAQTNFNFLNGIGKPQAVTWIILTTAVLNTLANLYMIPRYGMEGAALATALSYVLFFVWSFVIVRRTLPFRLEKTAPILFSSAMFLCLLFILSKTLALPLLTGAFVTFFLASIGYCALLLVFRVVGMDELRLLVARRR